MNAGRRSPLVMGAVIALISLPVLLVLVDAVTYREANRTNGAFVFAGQDRQYLLYVPKSYDRTKPTPLVISMHGAGGFPVQQRDLSEWNAIADREGFIVVYPSGYEGAGPRIWHVEQEPGLMRDVGFISAMIDTIEAHYRIDTARVYANGISNGGGMSFVLSCTMPDRIAAVGLVAAAHTLPFRWCTDHHPVPMISFHGTADPDIPYDGGPTWMAPGSFPNLLTFTKLWARRNQCAAKPVDSMVATDVTRLEYTNCADDAAVVLYTIRDGGHTWPGGQPMAEWWVGRTSNSVNATRLMWEFFQAHPMRRINGTVFPPVPNPRTP